MSRFELPRAFLSFVLLAVISRTAGSPAGSPAFPFSPGFDIQNVAALAKSLPSHSWEFGTATETLLELYDADHSVFGAHPFPVPTIQPADSQALSYAQANIVIGTPPDGLSDGDGAVGDPASLGVGAVMLGKTNGSYAAAATAEIDYLLTQAPRWPNGAISHRAQYAELWADFVYMAPPFIAYYGVATNNATILKAGVDQCILYQQVLIANTTTASPSPPSSHPVSAAGLLTHIDGPVSDDPGIWSTGNGWYTAGTARVLATLLKAPSSIFQSGAETSGKWRAGAAATLVGLIKEVLEGAISANTDGNLLRNYIDDTTWFGEISGTNLLASVAFRLATLSKTSSLGSPLISTADSLRYIAWAQNVRTTMGTNGHITSNGTAIPAINPLNWGDRTPWTAGSPEGQNFVVLMYAAWRDCVEAKVVGCT
ncbi:hypothetical protein HYPSUDRAFT_190583 [Hypholoma sublateritium FD-334 SS-4]|uniref:Glycoside hydrolase family 105 protein n=1 Tax=Hypholoma sublateritium (strain FD-334 SS-4) TaxID=945553 RepID=A0A0D2M6I7_HYPSF|nr:hypothetical protein HYPSUDRAFT_190583 [Hypholoma sublateritium FD-334 SS-4]